MTISSDVNVIFAYNDTTHKFNKKVYFYMAKQKRNSYLLLAQVKATFIYKYTDYLETACNIIDKAIRDEKEKRSKSPSQKYRPNSLVISENINKAIDDLIIQENARFMNYNAKAVKDFVNLLLSEYSIPKLYEDDDAFGEFREKYTTNSEQIAEDVLNKFLKFFQKFGTKRIEEYDNYQKWFQNIKNSKENIFDNKQDYEDMKLSAEFLSYNEEVRTLNFFTCDKNCHNSIKKVAKEYRLRIGQIHLVK
ncbi:MAG: hypothetical protein KAT43_03545 [Nanoarchaeota archaeon]|nr:hypothetical protein [Nanoarchaeota archaeon]